MTAGSAGSAAPTSYLAMPAPCRRARHRRPARQLREYRGGFRGAERVVDLTHGRLEAAIARTRLIWCPTILVNTPAWDQPAPPAPKRPLRGLPKSLGPMIDPTQKKAIHVAGLCAAVSAEGIAGRASSKCRKPRRDYAQDQSVYD